MIRNHHPKSNHHKDEKRQKTWAHIYWTPLNPCEDFDKILPSHHMALTVESDKLHGTMTSDG